MPRGLAVIACAVLAASGVVHADVCDAIPIWRDGRPAGTVCRAEARAHGLTVIDLRDTWVPPVLAAGPDGGPAYRATYLALAQERFAEAGSEGELASDDRYLELFGILPTLSVVRARLADDERHRCHAAVDDTALATVTEPIIVDRVARAKRQLATARRLRAKLDREPADDKLAAESARPDVRSAYLRYRTAWLDAFEARVAAVRAVQAHLACDELLRFRPIAGAYTWQTSRAIRAFQRGTMILPHGVIDASTRAALLTDSRERDFRTALRVLRARVGAATGLIEDGSAATGQALVLGRRLEHEEIWRVRGHAPLPHAAPDLVSAATEAAARALGWLDPASTGAFLTRHAAGEVAIALPPLPSYHAAPMELSIEIDRGDVWYDSKPRSRTIWRRPALIIYAHDGTRRIPLARMPTTIGGWQDEKRRDGVIVKARKDSPAGRRVWRDLYVGPTWIPPDSTPDRELVRRVRGRYVLAQYAVGPSYRGAFGLVAFPHLAEVRRGQLAYRGVRTHGTGDVVSIAYGTSHGCHRLLGAHAIRLGSFVLRHREHVRRGNVATRYSRVFKHEGRFRIRVNTRGYRIELVPPITVDILPGRIHPGPAYADRRARDRA